MEFLKKMNMKVILLIKLFANEIVISENADVLRMGELFHYGQNKMLMLSSIIFFIIKILCKINQCDKSKTTISVQ
jgi:hypothetical protein